MESPSFLRTKFIFFILTVIGLTACDHARILPGDARAPASKNCTICLENISNKKISSQLAYACDQGHCIDRECLAYQVSSLANVKELETKGLPCCGENCKDRISLTKVRDLLNPEDRQALDIRLAKASTPGVDQSPDHNPQTDTQRLSQGIEEAFNLCCPKEGCGAILGQIEGCNAATCSNDECKATFCYLCLEPQKDNRAAHAHVRRHSGNFWEMRPGFTERYHWIIARQKLSHLFEKRFKWYQRVFSGKKRMEKKVDDMVRSAVLESKRALLDENNMWPMPAGITSEEWLQEVKDDFTQAMNQENMTETIKANIKKKNVELLQNEYIYRRQEKEKKNASVIQAELERLGAPVLASLDVRDAGESSVQAAAVQIIPVMDDDPRVNRQFARLGNMYEVADLIWSAVVREKMNHQDAEQFCQNLGEGSLLPSRENYDALRVAMGYPNNYNPNLLPDMAGNWFCSSSVDGNFFAWRFNGNSGDIFSDDRFSKRSVRCVRPAGQRE